MKSFRDIRVIPVVLIAIFALAVLKVAGLVIEGGYVFDYQPQTTARSWAQETFNFPTGKNDRMDITGSIQEKPKQETAKGGRPQGGRRQGRPSPRGKGQGRRPRTQLASRARLYPHRSARSSSVC